MESQDMNQPQDEGIAQALPGVLVPTMYDDQMSVTVETQVLDANSFYFALNQPSVARFELPRKAVLASNSDLVFTAQWTNPQNVATNQATLPKMGGGLVLIKSARISAGGKLLQSVENCGQYIYVKDYCYKPWEERVGIHDIKLGAESAYSIDTDGFVVFDPEHDYRKGSDGIECCISLNQLFPIFSDVELPLAMLNHNVLIEIQFESVWANVWTELTDAINLTPATTPWADDNRVFTITRPRLLVDYVNYPVEVMQALIAQLKKGIQMPFRDMVVVRKTQPVGQATHDIGMSNELVSKMFIQKLATGDTPSADIKGSRVQFQKSLRSDYSPIEIYNFLVNNKLLYDRDVTKDAEKYSYLNQCNPANFRTLPGMYERNAASGDAIDFIAQNATGADGRQLTSIHRLQGSQAFLGVNMGAYRAVDDSPLNAVAIQDTPIVLKYTTTAACTLNCYIEKVRSGMLVAGEIMVNA